MNRFIDITGETFGGRTVTGLSHQNPSSRNYYWHAVCNACDWCGVVSGTGLRKGSGCPSCAGKVSGRKGLDTQAKGIPVYFIRCVNFVKVGCSKNPEKRLKAMMTANPYPLQLLRVDTEYEEKYWHELLKDCHFKGEWYLYHMVKRIVDLT